MMTELQSSGGDLFFIGIDFGTTFTKIAWAYSRRKTEQFMVTWSAGGESTVPSTICYKKDGSITWGYEASRDDPLTIQWFKLLLVDEKDMEERVKSCKYTRAAKVAIANAHKQPQDVVKDYLSFVWARTIESIGLKLSDTVVQSLPFRVFLTVPATWSETPHATSRLKEAAKQAGILKHRSCGETKLGIVSEPEAAAYSIFMDPINEVNLDNGDIFVVCDAGGGTVDLVTYEMDNIETKSVKECVKGEGDVCGSIFIDDQMESRLAEWLGRRWTSLSVEERMTFRNNTWSSIKTNFDGSTQPSYAQIGKGSTISDLVPFRKKNKALRVEKHGVYFEKESLATIFAEAEKRVLGLIERQIQGVRNARGRSPRMIILVGGLGSNVYLRKQIKEKYPNISIIQRDAQETTTAVCRGAASKARAYFSAELCDGGLERLPPARGVISRIARISYGLTYFEAFDEEKHGSNKEFDEPSKKWIANNLMYWYVKKGEPVLDNDRPTYSFKRYLRSPPPNNRFEINIWKCSTDNPPDSKKGRPDIFHFTNVLCSLDMAFEELPRSENPLYREVTFQLDLVPDGPLLKFVTKINGQVRGSRGLDMSYVS